MTVIRVLEYVGDAAWIKRTFDHNGVKRVHVNANNTYIRELVLGKDTPFGQRAKLAWRILRGQF